MRNLVGVHGWKRALLAPLVIGAVSFALVAGVAAGSSPRMVRLGFEVLPGLAKDRQLGALGSNQTVVVAVTVKHDLAALYRAERSLYDPASPGYHRFLEPAQWRARYGTPAARLSAIRHFVTRHGLRLYDAGRLGDYVMAYGSPAQVQRTFSVRLARFRSASGQRFFANLNAPRVPAGLGIAAVLGLEDRDAFHLADLSHSTGPAKGGSGKGKGVKNVAAGGTQPQCIPDPQSSSGNACTGIMQPKDLWGAYDMPANDLGQGQTIGIIGEGQTADVISALQEFEKTRGLPFVPVQVIHTDPGDAGVAEAKRDDSGRIEWEMDTQSSTGMAPEVSQVRMYFGTSLALTELTGAIANWVNDPAGPLQVSASLGACEDTPATNTLYGASQSEDEVLLAQAAMEGRTLFAAAGDTGSGCAVAVAENGIQYGPIPADDYPGVDPNAVSVGGTILYTDGQGHRVFERAWDHTGGGPSHWIAQPSYQTGASPLLEANACAVSQNGTPFPPGQLCRGANDVAAESGDITISAVHRFGDAGLSSPVSANGFDMVDYCPPTTATAATDAATPPCAYDAAPGKMTDHFAEGGTSLSSPLWLGMWARVQAHHDAVDATTFAPKDSSSLGFANYLIYKLAQGAKTARDFNDVAAGANPLPAGPGYDYPTGWGTPDVTYLTEDASGGSSSTAPVSNVAPGKSDPAPIYAQYPTGPSCHYLFYSSNPQAPDPITGQQDSQLAIGEGDMGLTADGKSLRVVLSIQDLSKQIPTGSDYLDYEVFWNYTPAGASSPTTFAADVQVDEFGDVTYTDGTETETSAGGTTNYQFNPSSTSHATGTFGSGPNGKIEIDVPLADVGNPGSGAVLSAPAAYTADGVNAVATGLGFIVDQIGPGNSYTLGGPTCLSGT